MYMKCGSHLDYIQQYINPVKHTNYTDDALQQPSTSLTGIWSLAK